MSILRAVGGLLVFALALIITWAAFAQPALHGDFFEQFDVIATLPWGKAALADLYGGFVLFTILVFLTERSWIATAAWAAPVFVLGNVWAALWFVLRLPRLAKLLSREA